MGDKTYSPHSYYCGNTAARAIAVRDERGEADTEELRKAVVHYRALLDELLEVEVREAKQEIMPAK